jgi:hypothetical protein
MSFGPFKILLWLHRDQLRHARLYGSFVRFGDTQKIKVVQKRMRDRHYPIIFRPKKLDFF